ncbi:MAG: DUF2220 domain-containing protein [Eubacterium sp.]|nr:DUF2220 domain-containing protein [Eubacterium sp.]
MKRISLEKIEQKLHAASYEELCRHIYGQVESGSLKPVKASKTNGKKPALYEEYWITDMPQALHDMAYKEELQYKMNTKLSVDYYLRHLDQYSKDREWVQMLNAYMQKTQGSRQEPISKNERSFQIWGREKFLQQEQGKKILKRCGIDMAELSIYETSEPLAYYSSHRNTPQNLLILENKDTFYSMRRHLLEQKEQILGVPFGTLVYGAGKGILRSFQDFSFCVEPYMRAQENEIYYFGDLDYEGIGIYERLAESFLQQGYQILPFVRAYEKMLEKAHSVSSLPFTKEKQNRSISGHFFSFFTAQAAGGMKQLLEDGRYIPQEIINIGDF